MLADVLGVMLWGSHAKGSAQTSSDVDVCLVCGPGGSIERAYESAWRKARLVDARFDVKVFEELPLYLQGEVIDRGILVASRDEAALWEYLRDFRKVWEDQSVRRLGREEFDRLVEARRRKSDA